MTGSIGKYELKRLLATGGMAEVWVAAQSGPAGFQKEIAIKRILPHLARDERFTQMFLDEASIASRLVHPNIAQIYELGEVEGEYFIAMEYIDGLDLAQILDLCEEQGVFIPIDIATRIVADVLSALDFAHEYSEDGRCLDVVHRDVSPHNVLVSNSGMVKLVDFGVAKAVEKRSKTQTGVVKGKLSYMPPEQIRQDPIDRRADVFAVGVLFFELLVNSPPFGRDITAVSAILNDEPADPRESRPEIPAALVGVILKALRKNPDDRFDTAHLMMADLEGYLRASDAFVSAREIAKWLGHLKDGTAPKREPGSLFRAAVSDEAHQAVTRNATTAPPTAEVRAQEASISLEQPRSVAVPMIIILALFIVVSGWFFRQQLGLAVDANDSRPDPSEVAQAMDPAQGRVDSAQKPVGAEFAALSEKELDHRDNEPSKLVFLESDEFSDAEMAPVVALYTGYSPEDLLVWTLPDQITQESQRFDPGDPNVVAVLVGLDKEKAKRKRRKSKKTKKIKRSKSRKKKSRKKKSRKKKSRKKKSRKKKSRKKKKKQRDDFRRIDNSMPSF